MDYKERIEAAKEQLKAADAVEYKLPDSAHAIRTAIYAIFPELKDNNARIRENIIETIHLYYGEPLEDEAKEMIAWLEKQDEQKLPIEKFHEGEWVVFNDKHESVYQIEKIENFQYTLRHILGGSMPLSFSDEDMIRLWTIQDAKDGDFLACPLPKGDGEQVFIFKETNKREYIDDCIEYYCRVCQGVFYESNMGFMGTASDEFKPATQEQRTLLIQKMHEAGYEWNPDKKKLEKKPKRMVSAEAKEALLNESEREALRTEYEKGRADAIAQMQQEWSEEDERIRQCLIQDQEEALDDVCNDKYGHSEIISDLKEMYHERIDWLKYLRGRYTWKPSLSQLNALGVVAKGNAPDDIEEINSLYSDLKKLKGE